MGAENRSSGVQNQPPNSRVHKAVYFGLLAVLIFVLGATVGMRREQFNYSSVDQVYNILKQNYDGKLDKSKLEDGLKTGLAEATGDPYTQYFSAKEARSFENQLQGRLFSGIGAELGRDAGGNLLVVSPIAGSPAAKAGVRAQDIIVAINHAPTSGLSIDQAIGKIRGKKGTTVALKIIRSKSQELNLTIKRDDITIPSVKSEILDGNIGYLQIRQFSDNTTSLARQAALDFKAKQVKGVVLDLRDDPGGWLDGAVDLSSLWLPSGKLILQEKRGSTVEHTSLANGNNPLVGVPTVALINAGSASAAEITAGALRDNNAAKLVGEKSYGKGSVQKIFELQDGAELKVTIHRWYRPNGQNIDRKGITPDKVVKFTDDDFNSGRDPQKDAALQLLRAN